MKKDQNPYARWASRADPEEFYQIPPHPSGYGRVEGSRHVFFLHGKDAAAIVTVNGTVNAENTKGVFYDN